MILVSGAGGRLGGLVAQALAADGRVEGVVLGTRAPARIAPLAALGFATVALDFADPESLARAFDGVDTLLLISATGATETRIPLHRAAIDAAARAGVGRIVYTSRVNPSRASRYPFAPIHADSEERLIASGIPLTIVRNNEYAENLGLPLKHARSAGVMMAPGAHGRVPWIAVADIAAILARLLVEGGHAGRTYELNGPEATSAADVAATLSQVLGREIVAPADKATYLAFIGSLGLPRYVEEMTDGMYDAVDAGEFAAVYPDAARLLGRPLRTVKDYLAGAVAT